MRKQIFLIAVPVILGALFIIGCKSEEPYVAMQEPKPAVQPAPLTPEVPKAKEPAKVETLAQQTTEAGQVKPVVSEPVQPPVQTKAAEPNEYQIPTDPNTVLVAVNGANITEGQLEAVLNPMLKTREATKQKTSPTLLDRYRSQTLDNLITDLLVRQQLAANNIVVTDDEIDAYISKMVSASDPPMTIDDLKKGIEAQGQTYEKWKGMMGFKKRFEMEKLLEKSYPDQLKVTDEEAKKYYDDKQTLFNRPEQVRASHILIKPKPLDPNDNERAKAAARQKAEEILQKVKAGEDFAELAKQNSDCPSAKKGGDLSYFDRQTMVPAFSDAAFALKVGETSGIVETQYGYHIIKVTDHKDASVTSFEKARIGIVDMLRSQKVQELMSGYLEKIREQANIVYPPGSTLRAYQPYRSLVRPEQQAAPKTENK